MHPGVPVELVVRQLGGQEFLVQATSTDRVSSVIEKLALQSNSTTDCITLVSGTSKLRPRDILESLGVENGSELFMVLGPGCPDWAQKKGFTSEHRELLRQYIATHKLQDQDWHSSDEGMWKKLEIELANCEERKRSCNGWRSSISLFLSDGEANSIFKAKPGEEIGIAAEGHMHNNKGDSCIHQVLLALDTTIVAELANNVPGRGRKIPRKQIKLKAPKEPGPYMLWANSQLQYSMQGARNNFQRCHSVANIAQRYPGNFVGWVVVEL